ncbi:MAG: hypothetical protein ACFCBV_12355 [Phycisphaerales bacterium]
MDDRSILKGILRSRQTGPTMPTFGEVHRVHGLLEIRWSGDSGWFDQRTSVASVGASPSFMNFSEGVLHTTSMHGFCSPAWSLNGLDEREVALLIHESALSSDSEGAQHFRQLNPQAMAMLARGKLQYRNAHPIGYVRNAVFFSLVTVLGYCAVRGRADLWLDRVTRAIGPPQRDPYACPNCGYDIRGVDQCPECGREI